MKNKKVWFITGASKGLGLALVQKLLKQGYRVAATSRSQSNLEQAVGIASGSDFLPLEVDLTSGTSIAHAVAKVAEVFSTIDVVVNNAGYGIGGTIEELSEKEIEDSFNINVFGTTRVIQQVLPLLREQGSGHIINVSSIAGFAPATGWSMYAATKYAVMGLSEVLAQDVKDLGIYVTVVAPGAFRTAFLTEESLVFSSETLEEYKAVRESHAKYATMDGQQQGDPDKAADMFIQLAAMKQPPVQFFMGSDAYNRAKQKVEQLSENLKQFKALSAQTDF